MNMPKSRWYLRLLGLAVFAVILTRIDVRGVAGTLGDARLEYVLAAVLLSVPFTACKAWRWRHLLRLQGIHYPYGRAFILYVTGAFLGAATPGRLGDFVKAFVLKREKGIPVALGASSVLVDRLFDLGTLSVFTLWGILAFHPPIPVRWGTVALVLIGLVALLLLMGRRLKRWASRALWRVVPASVGDAVSDFYGGMKQLWSPKLLLSCAASFSAYLIYFVGCRYMAHAVSIDLSYMYLAFAVSAANIVSLLPVSVSGIGTRDALLIVLFRSVGLSSESALAFSVVFLVATNVFLAFGGLVWWLTGRGLAECGMRNAECGMRKADGTE